MVIGSLGQGRPARSRVTPTFSLSIWCWRLRAWTVKSSFSGFHARGRPDQPADLTSGGEGLPERGGVVDLHDRRSVVAGSVPYRRATAARGQGRHDQRSRTGQSRRKASRRRTRPASGCASLCSSVERPRSSVRSRRDPIQSDPIRGRHPGQPAAPAAGRPIDLVCHDPRPYSGGDPSPERCRVGPPPHTDRLTAGRTPVPGPPCILRSHPWPSVSGPPAWTPANPSASALALAAWGGTPALSRRGGST